MGVLPLLPGSGDDDNSLRYRLPKATAEVLADPHHSQYDIGMIQLVPSLVDRSKAMLPRAFDTGLGRAYDDEDISAAIDRHHFKLVHNVFIPKVLLPVLDGAVANLLEKGCNVADLGCGAGVLLRALAKAYPRSTFHGFEVSKQALQRAAFEIASAHLTNITIHDATKSGESLGDFENAFDLVLTLDVLHDCPFPDDLIGQVKTAVKPQDGVWLLADIASLPTLRENIQSPGGALMLAFSNCLCMSCALSVDGGAGLGTLGFSVPVARKMIVEEGGFQSIKIILEEEETRFFLVQ